MRRWPVINVISFVVINSRTRLKIQARKTFVSSPTFSPGTVYPPLPADVPARDGMPACHSLRVTAWENIHDNNVAERL